MKRGKAYVVPSTEIVLGAYAECQLFLAESDIRHRLAEHESESDIEVDDYEEDETVELTMYVEFTSPWE